MRRLALAVLLLAPLTAFASPCKFEAPRNLELDLAGVKSVHIEVHGQDLHLVGSDGNQRLNLTGRACASEQAALEHLQVTQRREDDQLWLDIGGRGHASFSLFGSSYANLEVSVQLPASMPVDVTVGSGDADVRGVRELQTIVGSGDLHVRQVAGKFSTSVGSGDVEANDVGSLHAGSVGSGELKVAAIKGDAKVGSIGSGNVTLRQVGGSVSADTLGSGDLTVNDVAGDFTLGARGSGEVNHAGVKGRVSVPHDDD